MLINVYILVTGIVPDLERERQSHLDEQVARPEVMLAISMHEHFDVEAALPVVVLRRALCVHCERARKHATS